MEKEKRLKLQKWAPAGILIGIPLLVVAVVYLVGFLSVSPAQIELAGLIATLLLSIILTIVYVDMALTQRENLELDTIKTTRQMVWHTVYVDTNTFYVWMNNIGETPIFTTIQFDMEIPSPSLSAHSSRLNLDREVEQGVSKAYVESEDGLVTQSSQMIIKVESEQFDGIQWVDFSQVMEMLRSESIETCSITVRLCIQDPSEETFYKLVESEFPTKSVTSFEDFMEYAWENKENPNTYYDIENLALRRWQSEETDEGSLIQNLGNLLKK